MKVSPRFEFRHVELQTTQTPSLTLTLSLRYYKPKTYHQPNSDRIGAYPSTLMASGCVHSLESWTRRLMPVMSHRNPHQAMPSCQRLSPGSRGAWWDAETLVFPLFLQYGGKTMSTVRALCLKKAFWQTGVIHATHKAKPSKTVPLYPLPNSGLFLAVVEHHILV